MPAYSSPGRTTSALTTRVKSPSLMPPVIRVHVLPESVVRYSSGAQSSSLYRVTAMYAVPRSWGDGSMVLTVAHSGTSGGVTFRQVAPPFVVRCTSPSSEPAHSVSASRGDSASANMVP